MIFFKLFILKKYILNLLVVHKNQLMHYYINRDELNSSKILFLVEQKLN